MSRSFAPTPAELALVGQIFARADSQKVGILTGDIAVDVFAGSKLPPAVLGEVWQIADEENQGFLTRKGVAIALRLIGHAQQGEAVTAESVNKPGPLGRIEGYAVPTPATPRPMSPALTGPPSLTPQDKAKFARLFAGCGPSNGLVSGDKARDVFMKSKLSVDKLSQIWALADTKGRGALDLTDFTIGMYLIQACMSGQLPFVPSSLPPGLYEQATAIATHATGGSGSFSPSLAGAFPGRNIAPQQTGTASPLQQQVTGQSRTGPPLPQRTPAMGQSAFGLQPQMTGTAQHWDVTAAEKVNSDRFFDTLDTQNTGYIEGDKAVPFMVQSGLPEDVLSQIWDLSDMKNEGRLSKDGFAIAMHLIQNKLAGKDVPASLPPTLIPPSMRGVAHSAVHSQIEPLRDLFWDDTPPSSSTAAPLQPQSTGTMHTRPPPPAVPARVAVNATVDPFNAGPFGNPASLDKDLLGDSDDEAPKPATSHPMEDKSAEIGNAQNQLASTTRSLTTAKTERAGVEQVLATQAAELSSLQTQLSSAKAAYETETRLLGTLRDRFAAQSTEIQKVKQELISAESDLSGMRVERAEIEGGLLRDKEEVRALHKRMKDVGTEMDMLKLEVEKARKDAKQQKGLLAIAKKQLSSREAERAKVEKELAEANQETAALTHEREAIEGELAKEMPVLAPAPQPPAASPPPAAMNGHADTVSIAAAQPLPLSPEPTGAQVSAYISPTNTGKSNNPFDRLAMGSSPSSSRTQSPFAIPFANATLPTPMSTVEPVGDHTSTVEMDDPFGFSHPGSQEQTTPQSDLLAPTASAHFEGDPAPEIQATTPRAAPAELSLGTGPMTPHSPANTDFFQTPPSTAAQSEHVHSPERSMAPAELAAQAASREPRSVPGGFPGHEDIMSPVQEKEVDESDSEDEADDVPLATLTAKGKAKDLDSPDNVALPPQQASLPIREDAPSSFDDAFGDGVATPKMAATPAAIPSSNGVDAFHNAFSPAHVPPISPVAHSKTPLNGLNEFDEAMSKLTGQQTDTTALSFDTTFDDDFDFGAATEPSASAAPVTNATKSLPAQTQAMPPGSNANGFDDIFTSSAAPGPPGLPVASAQPPFSFDDAFSSSAQAPDTTAASGVTSSFEDAFGFTPAAPTNQTGTASSKMSAISQFQPPPGPHPKIATPSSPIRGSSSSSMTRSASPPSRTTSPPPRHQSPRPRASDSTSSIHEKPEKEKKNSRLSIRLPFGKKKKDKAPPLPSSSTLAPPVEEPTGGGTPAAEDDIDSVKQICAMGFSRQQAVDALEATDYDVQKALNSLLGAQ